MVALGVDLGTTYTAAAVRRTDGSGRAASASIGLGARASAAASVVFIGPDGRWVVGDAAERRAHDRPDLVVREFKRRIGDPVPLVVGHARPLAESLAAGVVRWVVDRVTEQEGEAPSAIVLTHPASWGPYKLGRMREALEALSLEQVVLVSEPVAAAAHYASQARISDGAALAVYDLGGGTFDAAVVRKVGDEDFELLGVPGGLDDVGGSDFDEAVMRHVQHAARLPPIDLDDGEATAAMLRLRRECIEAKEALSDDTETTIPVLLPGLSTRTRLVRGEFEELVHDRLVETVDALAATIATSGIDAGDLDAILLVGGSSRIPLVCQLVSERIGRPIVLDADPKLVVALGAASIAGTRAIAPTSARHEPDGRSAASTVGPTATYVDSTTGGDERRTPPTTLRPVVTTAALGGSHRPRRRAAATIIGAAAGVAVAAGASVALIRSFDTPASPAFAQAHDLPAPDVDDTDSTPRAGQRPNRLSSASGVPTTTAGEVLAAIDPVDRPDTVAAVAAMVPIVGATIEEALSLTSGQGATWPALPFAPVPSTVVPGAAAPPPTTVTPASTSTVVLATTGSSAVADLIPAAPIIGPPSATTVPSRPSSTSPAPATTPPTLTTIASPSDPPPPTVTTTTSPPPETTTTDPPTTTSTPVEMLSDEGADSTTTSTLAPADPAAQWFTPENEVAP